MKTTLISINSTGLGVGGVNGRDLCGAPARAMCITLYRETECGNGIKCEIESTDKSFCSALMKRKRIIQMLISVMAESN